MKKYLLTTVCALTVMMSSNVWAQEKTDETMPPPPMEQQAKVNRADELADKLQLSTEQREQAKKIREAGRAKIKPLIEESRALHEKMEKLRQDNMNEFEKILTDEQKTQFEKMKTNFGKKFQHRRPRRHHDLEE